MLGFNSCTDLDKAAGTGGQSYTEQLDSSAEYQTCLKYGKTLLYAAGFVATEKSALWRQCLQDPMWLRQIPGHQVHKWVLE